MISLKASSRILTAVMRPQTQTLYFGTRAVGFTLTRVRFPLIVCSVWAGVKVHLHSAGLCRQFTFQSWSFLLYFCFFSPSSQCRARVTKAIPLEQPWCGITLSFLLHLSITKNRGAVCQTKAFCELQRENITGIVINCIGRKQKDQCLENKEQLLKMKHFMFNFATYCHSSWITVNHYKPYF